MAKTLEELTTEAKEITDEAGADFVGDPQWDIWLNRGYSELWSLVFRANKAILEKTFDFTIAGSATSVDITTQNPRAILKVERNPGKTERRFLRRTSLSQKNLLNDRAYRPQGNTLHIEREEWAPGDYRLYYVPTQGTLADSGPQVDTDSILDPWWRYSALWAAIRAVRKDDKDASDIVSELADLRAEIDNELRIKDGVEPWTTHDISPDVDTNFRHRFGFD